jgi:hypothetical protein
VQRAPTGGADDPLIGTFLAVLLKAIGPERKVISYQSAVVNDQLTLDNVLSPVIPAKGGIQSEKTGFRIKSGMTELQSHFWDTTLS